MNNLQQWGDNYLDSSENLSYNAYVGWKASTSGNIGLETLFSFENLSKIQKTLDIVLKNLHPKGKRIVVTIPQIANVVSNIYENSLPGQIGGIFSESVIPPAHPRNDIEEINQRTVQAIYNLLSTQFEVEENNKKLSIWNTVLGDFNENGLRAHAPIKTRNKHAQRMAFHMRY